MRKKELLLFAVYYVLIYMTNSIYGTYIYVYYKSAGFSLFQIGLLGAVGPAFSILIQPAWSLLCDRVKYRTTVLKAVIAGSGLVVLLYPLFKSFPHVLIITAAYMLFNTAVFPIGDSIAVARVKKLGFDFSSIRVGGTIGYIVVVVIAGCWFKNHLDSLFIINAIFLSLCFITVCLMKKDISAKSKTERVKLSVIIKNKKLLYILLFIMAISVASSYNWSFMGIMINSLGCSNDFLGFTCGLAAITEIPVLLLMPRLYKRFGVVKIVIFAGLMMSARLIICSFAGDIAAVMAAQLLQGVSYMTVHYSTINYINDELPQNAKSFGQSLLAVSQSGFGSIIGSVGGGYLSGVAGISTSYGIIGFSLLAISAGGAVKLLSRAGLKGGTRGV